MAVFTGGGVLKKFLSFLAKLQNLIVALLLAAFICVVLLAVFVRYTQIWSIGWPDELSRYLMIWMAFIAAGTGARTDAHFSIEIIYTVLPKRFHWIVIVLKTILTDFVLAYIYYISIEVTQMQLKMGQVSPAMHIPMWFMYIAVPVGCGLFLIQGTVGMFYKLRQLREEVDQT